MTEIANLTDIDIPSKERRGDLDFLEHPVGGPKVPAVMLGDVVQEQSSYLKQILQELRKTHPSQRCVLDLQFNNGARVLTSGADICHIQFMHMLMPVKSQYLVVSNSSLAVPIHVTLNEPIAKLVGLVVGNGITLAAGNYIIIEAELEWIEVSPLAAGPISMGVNNSGDGTEANGTITVYAFSTPDASGF